MVRTEKCETGYVVQARRRMTTLHRAGDKASLPVERVVLGLAESSAAVDIFIGKVGGGMECACGKGAD